MNFKDTVNTPLGTKALDRIECILRSGLAQIRSLRPITVPDPQLWRAMGRMPESIFRSDFEPTVRRLGCPPTTHILSFTVGLPFDLRVQPGTAYTHKIGSQAACTVNVHRNAVTQRPPVLSFLPQSEDEPTWKCHQAIAQLVGYISEGDKNLVSEGLSRKALSHMFDKMLEALNTYIAGYIFAVRDPRACLVGLRTLHPIALFSLWSVNDWENPTGGLFSLSTGRMAPPSSEPITHRETQRLLHGAKLYETDANPFIAAELHLVRAEAVEVDGDHRRCVIEANTGIEVFLSSLYRQLAIEDGISNTDIEARLGGGRNFLSVVSQEFHGRLGGTWDLSRPGAPPGDWYMNVYRPRCRAVHAGHRSTYEEASRALETAVEFRAWLIERVRRKRRFYPKTTAYFDPTTY